MLRHVSFALSLSLLALTAGADENATDYGSALELATSIRISDLMSNPEDFVGQRVRVEGLVDEVCPMKGCWIDILEAGSATTIRFKVDDDVIVFPVEAKGREVVAEGVLARIEMDEQAARRWLEHLAEEKGEAFDPESVTGPMTFYRIDGEGAQLR